MKQYRTKRAVTKLEDYPKTLVEALAAGSKLYYTGVPCPRGHDSPRRVANRGCVECHREVTYKRGVAQRAADPHYGRIVSIKGRAKRAGLGFDEVAIREVLEGMPDECPIFGVLFTTDGQNAPEVDRIVPELGYVRGNMWIISRRANTIKNNASPEELRIIADAVERRITEGSA